MKRNRNKKRLKDREHLDSEYVDREYVDYWGPKEGDILSGPNQEYWIYRNHKWKPIDYEEIRDPSKPAWNEYIQKPFREYSKETGITYELFEAYDEDK